MIVLYGDYKDLNYITPYQQGKESSVSIEEMEKLKPYWDMFINRELSLVECRIKGSEYLENIKIFICHHVFEKNEYTTYCIADKMSNGGNDYINHCKGHDRKFIDREKGVIIMERTEKKGKIPKTLEEIKKREIDFHTKILNTVDSTGFGGKQIIEVEEKEIQKWKNKVETRWFY